MKDYDHVIVWLDYFNKSLKRSTGRRVSKEKAIFDPTVEELQEAANAAGYQLADEGVNSQARFPRRPYVRSGYIMLAKKEGVKKAEMLETIAQKMNHKRNTKQKKDHR